MAAPRCWIEVYDPGKKDFVGVKWQDIVDLQIENNLELAADSFECTLRNDKLLSDFLRKEQEVKFYIGYVQDPVKWEKEELTHLFTGKIDGVKPNFGKSMTVRLLGRDFSAPLIDSEFSLAFAERTASQIAELLADKYGLAKQITETTVIVEKDLYKDKKEWAILQEIADREGFICYVDKNKALYFGPRTDDENQEISQTLIYRDTEKPQQSSLLSIEFDDSMLGIINRVVVRHWLGKHKQLIEARAINQDLIDKYGKKTRIIYSAKAKTQEVAQAEADKRLKQLSRAVVTAQGVSVLGNAALGAQKMLAIQNCGRFDGNYFVDRVQHRISMSGGYTCELNITTQLPDAAAQYRQDIYD